jgi:hypothetical protein
MYYLWIQSLIYGSVWISERWDIYRRWIQSHRWLWVDLVSKFYLEENK